ncbi:MAG: DUF294 nucleotidyltransferase-like domain-containing protein [Verrucomicrobiota bacterium JB022]|nr:DUF294 nucleotidyltransferase-like domain-containing protein [Verrucomicrobiota bacterium JB022]
MQRANVIPDRIASALGRYPPFTMLPEDVVQRLAEQARVRALVAEEIVWKQGELPQDELYFLARGRVEYHWDNGHGQELVDVRDMGDLLGLTAIMQQEPFRVTAVVVEDALLYVLSAEVMRKLLQEHDEARHYARRHLFWATRVGGKVPDQHEAQLQAKRTILQAHLDGAQMVQIRPVERLLTCLPTETIRQASTLMVAKRVPSILVVDNERRPLGMVTSVNLVKWGMVQGLSIDAPVKEVMASPVYTVSPTTSATSAMLLMLRQRVGQICVTEDGTPKSKALDVCTHKDLLAQSGHHPAGLLREIRFAKSTQRLRELCDEVEQIARSYVEAGISGIILGQICAELFDELVERLVTLATDELAAANVVLPELEWAWMTVGSDGRREQVLRTDMDNAFIFASTGDPAEDERNRQIFLQLTSRVVEMMVECGFSRCQGGVMASNPRWCRSEAEWREEILGFNSYDGEAMLRALVLYDLRYVAGNRDICERIRKVVFDAVAANDPLQRRIAELVLEVAPPLNFWGKFVVEKKGSQTGKLDIKGRALSPIRDTTRALALKYRLTRHYSTGGRLQQIQEEVPRLKEWASLAYDSYDFLLRLRILTGLKRGDTGRYIEPNALTKMERTYLSSVFDVVRMGQRNLQVEFHLEPRNR